MILDSSQLILFNHAMHLIFDSNLLHGRINPWSQKAFCALIDKALVFKWKIYVSDLVFEELKVGAEEKIIRFIEQIKALEQETNGLTLTSQFPKIDLNNCLAEYEKNLNKFFEEKGIQRTSKIADASVHDLFKMAAKKIAPLDTKDKFRDSVIFLSAIEHFKSIKEEVLFWTNDSSFVKSANLTPSRPANVRAIATEDLENLFRDMLSKDEQRKIKALEIAVTSEMEQRTKEVRKTIEGTLRPGVNFLDPRITELKYIYSNQSEATFRAGATGTVWALTPSQLPIQDLNSMGITSIPLLPMQPHVYTAPLIIEAKLDGNGIPTSVAFRPRILDDK